MRDGAPPLSVVDFVWEEIKGISLNPQKTFGFALYLMFIIEDATSRNFPKEGKHMPFRPNPTKKPLIPAAQVSSPPRAYPTPHQQHKAVEPVRPTGSTGQIDLGDQGQSSAQQREKFSSPLKMFGLLFDMCVSHHAVEKRLHEERKACKKLQKDMKKVKKALYPNKTPSPPGSLERESNPLTPLEQRYFNYENFDPTHLFAPYASTSHMGFGT
jgi:hypothetical protein